MELHYFIYFEYSEVFGGMYRANDWKIKKWFTVSARLYDSNSNFTNFISREILQISNISPDLRRRWAYSLQFSQFWYFIDTIQILKHEIRLLSSSIISCFYVCIIFVSYETKLKLKIYSLSTSNIRNHLYLCICLIRPV